jgi:hypothetical protein
MRSDHTARLLVAVACLVASSQGCRIGYDLIQDRAANDPNSAGVTSNGGAASSGGSATLGGASDAGQSDGGAAQSGTGATPGGPGGSSGGPSCPNRALSLDGATRAIFGGAALPLGNAPRTVELWLKVSAADWAPNHTPFEYGSHSVQVPGAFAVDLDVFPDIELYHRGVHAESSAYFGSGASADTWFHVAATYDGAQSNMFVDGSLVGSRVYSEPLQTGASSFFLGSSLDDFTFLTGVVDEVRVWSVARSQLEIQQSMSLQLAGSEAGLVAYWRLDDEAPALVDSSLQGNDGVVEGNAVWVDGVTLTCP